jgi:hypothetical protein
MSIDTSKAAPGGAVDLGMAPPAAPSPATPVTPDMSYDDAMAAKTRLLGDASWRARYVDGDVNAKAEMDALMVALTPKQPVPSDPASVEQAIDFLRERADIPEAVAQQLRDNRPVTMLERKLCEQMKGRLFADKAWVKRYLDGDRDAARQVAMINIILSSRVVG